MESVLIAGRPALPIWVGLGMAGLLLAVVAPRLRGQDSPAAGLPDTLQPATGPILQRRAWYVYPVPTSEALTGLKVTLIVAYLWRSSMDGVTRPSTAFVHAAYTAKHQLLVALAGTLWTPHNRRNLSFEVGFSRFPAPFFGIGPETRESAAELFTPRTFDANVTAEQEVLPHTRLQGGLSILKATIADRVPGGLLASGTTPGSSQYTVVAPLVGLVFDSRDQLYDPRSGTLFQAQLRASLPPLGASSGFQYGLLDARIYRPVAKSSVLAGQVVLEGARGTVPFAQLPQLGSGSLRSVVYGRWRDRTLLRAQAEWRQRLIWRFGAVAFAGGAVIGPSLGGLDNAPLRRFFGGGLRFNLSTKENANFSMDYALGPDSASELTFRFAEAF